MGRSVAVFIDRLLLDTFIPTKTTLKTVEPVCRLFQLCDGGDRMSTHAYTHTIPTFDNLTITAITAYPGLPSRRLSYLYSPNAFFRDSSLQNDALDPEFDVCIVWKDDGSESERMGTDRCEQNGRDVRMHHGTSCRHRVRCTSCWCG